MSLQQDEALSRPGVAVAIAVPSINLKSAKDTLRGKEPKRKMFSATPDARTISIFLKGEDDCLTLFRNEDCLTASLLPRA